MGAQAPQRPDPGHAMLLPRVAVGGAPNSAQQATQRAFDAVQATVQQIQKAAGVASAVGGALLAVRTFTASGDYSPSPGTTRVRLRMQAPGGPGGGAIAAAGVVSLGGGGASGAYVERWLTGAEVAAGTVTIGAAGAPTTGNGPISGDVTVTIAGATYTAKGGGGGGGGVQNGAAGVAASITARGQPQTGSTTSGTLNAAPGEAGFIYSAAAGGAAAGGDGGRAEMGMSGTTSGVNTQPAQPEGYGGGGAGAVAVNAAIVGGPGGPGRVELEEYS